MLVDVERLWGTYPMGSQDGILTLNDGAKLRLKIFILDAREAGFSPFGGVNIMVRPVGGITVEHIPHDLKEKMVDKPPAPLTDPPRDGWEIIEIESFEPALSELDVETSKGVFKIMVKAEPVMAARNINYKAAPELDEPLYHVSWVHKISWRPVGKG